MSAPQPYDLPEDEAYDEAFDDDLYEDDESSPFDFDDQPDEDLALEDEPDLEDLEDFGFDSTLLDDYGELGDDVLSAGLPELGELLAQEPDRPEEDRFDELDTSLVVADDRVPELDPAELAQLTAGPAATAPVGQDFTDFEDFGELEEGDAPRGRISYPRPAGSAAPEATSADAWADPRFLDRLFAKWEHDTLPPLQLPIERLGLWFLQSAEHLRPFVMRLFDNDPPLKEPPEGVGEALHRARKQFLLWNVQRMELHPTEDLELELQDSFRPEVHRLQFERCRVPWEAMERSSTVLLGHRVAWIHSLLAEFSFQPVSRWPIIAAELGRPDPPGSEPEAEADAIEPAPEPPPEAEAPSDTEASSATEEPSEPDTATEESAP